MDVQYDKIDIFNDNKDTLKETSKDDSNKEVSYMTDSLIEVVNFDRVKEQYIRGMKLSAPPCSNDALYVKKNNKIYFIEFKNGKMTNAQIYNVYNKVYDSLLIFTDIINQSITYCRKNVNYILVYNESKNPQDPQESQASSKALIAKHFTKKAKMKYVRFGLDRFEKIYFYEVFTYTEKEFNEKFISEFN